MNAVWHMITYNKFNKAHYKFTWLDDHFRAGIMVREVVNLLLVALVELDDIGVEQVASRDVLSSE